MAEPQGPNPGPPKRRWIVTGRKRETGAEVSVAVLSRSEDRAVNMVAATGIDVDRVEPDDRPSPPQITACEPPAAPVRHTSIQDLIQEIDGPLSDRARPDQGSSSDLDQEATAAQESTQREEFAPMPTCLICESPHLQFVRVPRLGGVVASFGRITAGLGTCGILLACGIWAFVLLRDPTVEMRPELDRVIWASASSLFIASWLLLGAGLALATRRRIIRCLRCSASFNAD